METHSFVVSEERIFLQDNLTCLDPPGSEETSTLSRRLLDGEGIAGRLMRFPILGLALLTTVGSLPTDATLQLHLRNDFAKVTGSHLLVTLWKHTDKVNSFLVLPLFKLAYLHCIDNQKIFEDETESFLEEPLEAETT